MSGIERINFFPVRHLSPAASHQLLRLLDRVKPDTVLIEGPSDADIIKDKLCSEGVILPAAILAYTAEIPVETVIYPFADYSPEYQAICWAVKHKVPVKFIDLPCAATLSFIRCEREIETKIETVNEENNNNENSVSSEIGDNSEKIYSAIARHAGAHDYDDYWERFFEHNLSENAYADALIFQSETIRSLTETMEEKNEPRHFALNLIRESYMRRKIEDELKRGIEPEKIVVVTGAYHTSALKNTAKPMTDNEIKNLPMIETKLTLMPYSYYRLSARSGYGAGNSAPAYYGMLWEHMQKGGLTTELAVNYFSVLGAFMRENGDFCPTSNIIEAVRLAESISSIRGGSSPTLLDMHDAAITCLGQGEESRIITALVKTDIGIAIGKLPEGMSQTSIQDDMQRELRILKLEKYKSVVAQDLALDLRENFKTASKESALLDLRRSVFFCRLETLKIDFAKHALVKKSDASWKEVWQLRWSPETEIQVVESVLKGETIALAAAFALKEQLDSCADVAAAAGLVASAYKCDLTANLSAALKILQRLSTEAESFVTTAEAARELSQLISYGDVRKADVEPVKPLLRQLFFKAGLILSANSSCNDDEAKNMAGAINTIHLISQENYDLVDDGEWVKSISELAARDDKNPVLSGLAFSILIERGIVSEEDCALEVSRRLSAGTPADIGASWFEGLSMRNRYALLSRPGLWKELDAHICGLEDEDFKRSVVILRRAFTNFESREKSGVAEILSAIWGTDMQRTSIKLTSELSEEESKALESLDEFEF